MVKKRKTKTGKRKVSVPTRLMIFLNLFFAFLLICSLLASHVSPLKFWPLAFAGIAYPVILFINLFFILFWIVFLKRFFLISLIAILLGYSQFLSFIQLRGTTESVFEKGYKVMSYNVRLFDLYNADNKAEFTRARHEMFQLMRSESVDILCLQEYYNGKKGSVNYADSLLKEGICKFSALALTHNGKKEIPFGLATFSNYPIISSRKMDFSNTNMSFCLVTDIAFPTDTVRVINVHLESIRFRKEDYMFVNELANNRNSGNDLKQGSRVILSKMKRAYMKRAVQVNELKAIIADSPYRTMVCGDFNDTPTSYVYRQVTEPIQDAFKIAGSGLGQTYRELLPILRIDYILPDKSMKVFHYKTIHSDLSDHYPIVARIGL